MGDFVNKPSFAEEDEQVSAVLPLFPPDHSQKQLPKVSAEHQAIKNFGLFVQEPYRGELHDLLEQWLEWTSEPKFFQLAEDSPANGRQNLKNQAGKKAGKKITKYIIHRRRGV